jgi:hypothetical protein
LTSKKKSRQKNARPGPFTATTYSLPIVAGRNQLKKENSPIEIKTVMRQNTFAVIIIFLNFNKGRGLSVRKKRELNS